MKRFFAALVITPTLLLGSPQAWSAMTSFSFEAITSNTGVRDIVATQLSLTAWDSTMANAEFGLSLAADEALFTVQNSAGIASSVSEIYFDGELSGPSIVVNSLSGSTNFSGGGANPGNLPGGNMVGFQATPELSADAQGNPSRGVDAADDTVGLILGLADFSDYDAMIAAVTAGDLSFGLHVRAINYKGKGGFSESFVNTSVVPVPAAIWLLGFGLVGLVGIGRKQQAKR